jgi:hypothetical protein
MSVVVVMILIGIAAKAYRVYRFASEGVTADARILHQGIDCFLAGPGILGNVSGHERMLVVFAVPDGHHSTWVVRPCRTIPPDFGRGRGAIWIQYDRQDPDRVRVVNDRSDLDAIKVLSVVLSIWVLAPLGIRQLVRTRR